VPHFARKCRVEWVTDWEWSERQSPPPRYAPRQCRNSGPISANTPSRRHWLIAPPPDMKQKSSPPPVDVDSSPKRARKGKDNEEFCSVKASIVLSVPPVFANRLRYGVEEMLDTMIMRCAYTPHFPFFSLFSFRRYESTLNGVVLAHSDVHFLDRVARLQADSPFAICHVGFDALIWKPCRGMKLSASIFYCALLPRPFLPQLLNWGRGEEHGLCPRY